MAVPHPAPRAGGWGAGGLAAHGRWSDAHGPRPADRLRLAPAVLGRPHGGHSRRRRPRRPGALPRRTLIPLPSSPKACRSSRMGAPSTEVVTALDDLERRGEAFVAFHAPHRPARPG